MTKTHQMKQPRFLMLGSACVLLGLAGCRSVQPASAVVDRQMVGQSKVESPAVAVQPPANPVLTGPSHTVKKGDTLFSIALDNGLYYKDLQSWNNLEDPNRIKIGQQLRLTAPNGGASSGAISRPIASVQAAPAGANQAHPVVEERPLGPPVAVSGVGGTAGKLLSEPKVAKLPYSADAYARLQRGAVSGAGKQEAKTTAPSAPELSKSATTDTMATVTTGRWIWPAQGKVLGGFGDAGSKGVDIAGNAGDPVKSVADGKVVYVGTGLRGYGQMVIVKHDSNYLTAYAHNQKLLVAEGQSVTQGQKIAEMGSSDADRVKLHFEVRKNGKPVDPVAYLPK